jgi:hypothetical protein
MIRDHPLASGPTVLKEKFFYASLSDVGIRNTTAIACRRSRSNLEAATPAGPSPTRPYTSGESAASQAAGTLREAQITT